MDDYYIDGDNLYKDSNGEVVFPIGIYKIYESKAPTGYLLNEESYGVNVYSNNSVKDVIDTYNAPTIPEQIKRGDFEFDKKAFDTQRSMANVEFTITSKTNLMQVCIRFLLHIYAIKKIKIFCYFVPHFAILATYSM